MVFLIEIFATCRDFSVAAEGGCAPYSFVFLVAALPGSITNPRFLLFSREFSTPA